MSALHLGPNIEGSYVPIESCTEVREINEEDDEDFQDACESIPPQPAAAMNLETSLLEANLALDYFFNNRFAEARNILKPWASTSMYHSVGTSVFAVLEAVLTFEPQHILEAASALKVCLSVCNRHRKKVTITETIGKTFKRPNYESYTALEAHAELCAAEALLMRAMITFIEDETLTSLIKGGMKIRACFGSYKECSMLLNQVKWPSAETRLHFESGVRVGLGGFNLMVSLLPGRVIRLLEFIGFSGNKELGMRELLAGYHLKGLRQVLCVMGLLGYHLIVCYVLSHREGDLAFCDEILEQQLEIYPNGVWFLFFKGRLEFMRGNLEEATQWYKKSWRSQNVWPQFHHVCFWELLWINCLRQQWREGLLYASNLLDHSRWSRTIYTYQKAAILMQIPEEDLTPDERRSIEFLMRDAPLHKQRIAGKSIPLEKFVVKKCERFFAQGKYLLLAAVELMYIWNMFKILGRHFHLADGIMKLIDKVTADDRMPRTKFDADNRALANLLKGACLKQMKSPLQALKHFEAVVAMHKDIKEDTYLIPYAIVEIGLIYADQGKRESAIMALEDAKKNFTGYSLESRLHFRIHLALTDLRSNQSQKDS
ncbi:tetratricopeptide repeat protein 39B-like [Lutzomyia longipalpis]|nr:tetratricopeptide repeat protein 39B-like [Lutzomyia longipalpis]